jgi:hypothetical protein
LFEELLHALLVFGLVRVDLGVDPLKIRLRDNSRGAMSRARNKEHIKAILLDESVHVNPSKRLAGIRSPMTQEPSFEMLQFERFGKKRIFTKVQHAQAKVHASTEVSIHLPNLLGIKRLSLHRRASFSISRDTLLARIWCHAV